MVRAATTPTSPTAGEGTFKNIAKNTCTAASRIKNFAKDLEGIVEPTRPAHAGSGGEGAMPVPIISISFLLVGENFIRFPNLLKLLLRFLVSLVFVGVMLHGQFAIGFFDFLRGRSLGDAQNFVVIFFGRHGLRGGRAHGDDTGRTQKAVPELKAASALMKDGTLRFSLRCFLSEGFMPVWVERLAHGFNGGDAVFG